MSGFIAAGGIVSIAGEQYAIGCGTPAVAQSHAARIARHLNAHDDLVAALQSIADSWQPHGSETRNAIADAMAEKARAALVKAGAL